MADKPASEAAAITSADAAERPDGIERTATALSIGMADSTPYQARRMATAATAPDDLAPSGPDPQDSKDGEEAKPPPKPFVDRVLGKIGLSVPLVLMMFKGALAPTIGIAMYQADAINTRFPTLGYLIPIVTLLSAPILPRGKFAQMLALNLFFICFGSALAMLIMYSGVKARENTSAPLTEEQLLVYKTTGAPPYNSSQSAVIGVWLFVATYFGNLLRAKVPALNVPVIIYSILISVATTYGPAMVTISTCKSFIKQIIEAMLFAMALSMGVSLFVIPTTSRQVLMTQMAGTIGLLRKAVKLQGEYLQGLEREDMYALATVETAVGDLGPAVARWEQKKRWWWPWGTKEEKPAPPLTKEAKAAHSLRTTIGALHELTGKMQTELRFAKRDAAFGKLSAHDLGVIMRQLRDVSIPVTGMSTIMDIFRRTAENRGWNEAFDEKTTLGGGGSSGGQSPTTSGSEEDDETPAATAAEAEARRAARALALEQERHIWNEIMKKLHEPFTLLSDAVDAGLEHAGLQLGLLPRTKEQKARYREQRKRKIATGVIGVATATASPAAAAAAASRPGGGDVEAAFELQPGDEGFAAVVDQKVEQFHSTRNEILRVWARERGLIIETEKDQSNKIGLDPVFLEKETRQSQLYVLLYMEQLMQATGKAVQDLVMLADKRVADGTMDKRRLMYPTLRLLRKWVVSVLRDHEDTNGGDESPDAVERSNNVVYMGDGFGAKHDPEHLPPTNAWQRFGNGIRAVSRLLGSQESLFGLRAACATMSIGILCFLEPTQTFFRQQRLVWALIMIAIAMSQTSGQSIFGFFCRVGGSFLATVFCYIIWYIAGQKTAGVIVFLWLFLFCEFYFLFKYPRFVAASMITLVTQVLIVGYELQVRRIGIAKSESSGQHYYPIYELAPYRLATVAGGCFVAFIWTIFPQPMTDRAWLRRDLSATMYLLANYFSAINETLRAAMEQTAGDIDVHGTPAYQLQKVRRKLFSKLMVLLPSLQAHSNWQRWEPAIGGRYPREAYEDIILRASRILNYLTLVSYTVTWKPQHTAASPVDTRWLQTLAQLMRSIGPTHYTILSTLTLLSNSLLSGQSLPPYIPLPRPYELTQHLLTLMERGSDGKGGSQMGTRVGRQNTRRQSDARMTCWQAVGDKESHTAAGLPELMRIPTRTASSLGRVLDASNLEHTGYTEFAVLQVCSTLICDDLEGLIHTVSELVGVVDFSFRVHPDNGKSKAD